MLIKQNKSAISLKINHSIHDLKNILTSTLSATEILESLFENNNKSLKLLKTIKSNSFRAIDIINDLSNTRNKSKIDIDISDVLSSLEATIKPTLPRKIKLNFRMGKNLCKINGNFSDFYRLFLNLIINSLESIGNTGVITFSVKNSKKKDFVIFSVKDNGVGIPSKLLNEIFYDGYSLKRNKSNSGHGLAIAKKIVDEHCGIITVNSEINSGTEFQISFPAISVTENKKGSTIRRKILLADDDTIILELLSELLEVSNFNVTTASNGKIALSKFKKEKFDLVIIDKSMPILDGIECIKSIRKINSEIPIILTTGFQETIDEDNSNLNINLLIKKPWSFDDMLKAIHSVTL